MLSKPILHICVAAKLWEVKLCVLRHITFIFSSLSRMLLSLVTAVTARLRCGKILRFATRDFLRLKFEQLSVSSIKILCAASECIEITNVNLDAYQFDVILTLGSTYGRSHGGILARALCLFHRLSFLPIFNSQTIIC